MAGAAAEAAGSATSPQDLSDYHTLLPKLVVFGGNGYVGSRVCQQALAMGCGVVNVSRSGRPRNLRGDWLDQVEWVQVGLRVVCRLRGAAGTCGAECVPLCSDCVARPAGQRHRRRCRRALRIAAADVIAT